MRYFNVKNVAGMREIMRRKIRMVYIYISMNDKNDLVKMVW